MHETILCDFIMSCRVGSFSTPHLGFCHFAHYRRSLKLFQVDLCNSRLFYVEQSLSADNITASETHFRVWQFESLLVRFRKRPAIQLSMVLSHQADFVVTLLKEQVYIPTDSQWTNMTSQVSPAPPTVTCQTSQRMLCNLLTF